MSTKSNLQKQPKKTHHGRNVKRCREILGIKQEFLADRLGLTQQKISRLETQEKLDDDTLHKIAKILNISIHAIKNFCDEVAANIFSNIFNNQSGASQSDYRPVSLIKELYEKNKELYERLLKSEQEKSALLEKMSSQQ
jgi:transcriptional regulator with XRE-family HTH domain